MHLRHNYVLLLRNTVRMHFVKDTKKKKKKQYPFSINSSRYIYPSSPNQSVVCLLSICFSLSGNRGAVCVAFYIKPYKINQIKRALVCRVFLLSPVFLYIIYIYIVHCVHGAHARDDTLTRGDFYKNWLKKRAEHRKFGPKDGRFVTVAGADVETHAVVYAASVSSWRPPVFRGAPLRHAYIFYVHRKSENK